jgi:hypothetical protein
MITWKSVHFSLISKLYEMLLFINVPGAQADIGAYEAQTAPSADFETDDDVNGVDFLAWQRGFSTANAQRADGSLVPFVTHVGSSLVTNAALSRLLSVLCLTATLAASNSGRWNPPLPRTTIPSPERLMQPTRRTPLGLSAEVKFTSRPE